MLQPAPLLQSLCAQLLAADQSTPAGTAWPLNPFPKGVRAGSATEMILSALVADHPRWFEHWELRRVCGMSRGAVSWAVRYLENAGLIRSISSSTRNPRYRRYQAIVRRES